MAEEPKAIRDQECDEVTGGAQFNPKEIKISQSVPWKAGSSATDGNDGVTDWPKAQEIR